ncbi:MAG: hypothetical protein ACM3WU_02640 [Bacillota bacterium]
MGAIYRLGLIMAGCYFEGAVRNATQLALYWIGKQDALQGFLPYLIPIFFGYVFALDVRSHWSDSLLKNDIMAYVGSTLLIGYPLLITLSLWFAGSGVDPATLRIRITATVLLLVNLIIAALVWRTAVRQGHPLSMPWGGVSRRSIDAGGDLADEESHPEEEPQSEEDPQTEEPHSEEDPQTEEPRADEEPQPEEGSLSEVESQT